MYNSIIYLIEPLSVGLWLYDLEPLALCDLKHPFSSLKLGESLQILLLTRHLGHDAAYCHDNLIRYSRYLEFWQRTNTSW